MSNKDDMLCSERDEQGIGKSFFPIEVKYENEKGKTIVNHPDDLKDLVSFRVLRLRVNQ